jgi:transposase
VRVRKLLQRALGVALAVITGVREEDDGATIVVGVRPRAKDAGRCPLCHRQCGRYDGGDGLRRWRTHDVGTTRAFIEAEAPRIECPEHGVLVAEVSWARPGSRFTIEFEQTAAWLAVRTDKTAVSEFLRVTWRAVGSIVERVCAAEQAKCPPLEGVTRIGIDEVAYRKGHRYLTCVVDHDSGRLLWASSGRDAANLRKFFRLLGKKGCAAIRLVSADAATWIAKVVREECPNAKLCMDPFHVVAWMTKAIDKVRRKLWNELRGAGETEQAKATKNTRWVLLKNPEDLNRKQRKKLRDLERENQPLYRVYLLKEQLREVFRVKGPVGALLLGVWLDWAEHSGLEPMARVAKSIRGNLDGILNSLFEGLSNARVESANTKLRLLTRMAFGFHSPGPLIALAHLKLGGLCPPLPHQN